MTTPDGSDELDEIIEKRIRIASEQTKSEDEVVHIAWLAKGIDLWHKSNGKVGHSPEEAERYIISSVSRLIADKQAEAVTEFIESIANEGVQKTGTRIKQLDMERWAQHMKELKGETNG